MVGVSALTRRLVRQRVEAQQQTQITILRGGLAVLDTVTGLLGGLTNARTIYAGKARIRTVAGSGASDIGGGEIDQRSTLISIPFNSPVPHRDDLVLVIDDVADVDLETRVFRVMEVEGGSLFASARRMSCTSWYESRYWGAQ